LPERKNDPTQRAEAGERMSPFVKWYGIDFQFGWLKESEKVAFSGYHSIQIYKFIFLWRLS
jgi:hypothetical protein